MSQTNIIHSLLKRARGRWVPMPELAVGSGSFNVHSRIDELRHKRGANIENKVRRNPTAKSSQTKCSFYRIPR